jgi:hypothetical protein
VIGDGVAGGGVARAGKSVSGAAHVVPSAYVAATRRTITNGASPRMMFISRQFARAVVGWPSIETPGANVPSRSIVSRWYSFPCASRDATANFTEDNAREPTRNDTHTMCWTLSAAADSM